MNYSWQELREFLITMTLGAVGLIILYVACFLIFHLMFHVMIAVVLVIAGLLIMWMLGDLLRLIFHLPRGPNT